MRLHSVADHLRIALATQRHFDDWAKVEKYFSLHEELAALARAGFLQPECFWRRRPLAIYGGLR